jgi:multicomponent Na+:H+ antiporter subunit D
MNALIPLTVAVPLIAAALLAAVGTHLPRLVPDAVAIGCAAAVTAMTVILTLRAGHQTIVYWFGGWRPVHGFAPGVGFVVDPLSAAEATLAAVAVLAALIFSWNHYEHVRQLFYSLMLAFLAGMVGFTLSGDLFNIFVFFELMSVAGYALSGYRVQRPEVLQGSIDFAVINSIGTFTLLMGIAVLYGRTGGLNLVNVGSALARDHPRGLLVVALTCVTVGFLVKAGVAPFHFWLSDAYAVATAPVAAVFTAVMSDLAFHTYAHVYTTVFAPSVSANEAVGRTLLALALLSAVIGAVMCFLEADLKRQLAFLTVSNGGVVLAGIAVLTATGLAGSIMFITAAGVLRGAFMLGLGMMIVRFGSADEIALRGHGRHRRHLLLGVLLAVCAAVLAAPPGFGPFLSLSMVYDALMRTGYGWVPVLLAACISVSAGTLLRATARIFLGWGAAHDPSLTSQPAEPGAVQKTSGRHHPVWVLGVPIGLVVAGIGLFFLPMLAGHAIKAASDLQDHVSQAHLVLQGIAPPPHPPPRYTVSWRGWAYSAASFAGALLVAAVGLWWQRLPDKLRQPLWTGAKPVITGIKAVHSGSVGDYAAWLVVGAAALALVWTAVLH